MNDRQLRYSCAVWRERSFSRAARKLAVSQPSVSEQVRLLEEEIGFPLFLRGPRGIEARSVGEAFLEKAEQVLDGMANLQLLGQQLRGNRETRVRIGINSGVDRSLLVRAMAIIGAELADIRFEVMTATSRRILRHIDQDRLDIGFLLGTEPDMFSPKVVRCPLGTVEMAAFVPAAHPLAAPDKQSVAFAELADQPLIITEGRGAVGHLVFELFGARGIIPTVVADSDNIETVKAMVAGGLGVALLPVNTVVAEDGIRMVPIADASTARIDMVHATKSANPLIEICIARLRDQLTEA